MPLRICRPLGKARQQLDLRWPEISLALPLQRIIILSRLYLLNRHTQGWVSESL